MKTSATMELGDCVDLLQRFDDGFFEVCVTSPPYNIGMNYAGFSDKREDYDEWTLRWLSEAVRVSRRGVLLNIGGSPSGQTALYRTLGAIASRFTIQNSIVWAKSMVVDGVSRGHVKPINSGKYLNVGHELILHVVKTPVEVDKLAVGVPYADKSNIARFGAEGRPDLRCAGSIWYVPYPTRQKELAHPASFPLALAARAIAYAGGSAPVLDPFMGSGTTLQAARDAGRSSHGIDIDAASIRVAKDRLGLRPDEIDS